VACRRFVAVAAASLGASRNVSNEVISGKFREEYKVAAARAAFLL
jgi:hypothetical protein